MMYHQECVVYFLVILVSSVASKLVLRELVVPPAVDVRDDVTLSCRFSLENERLYSVKWYKDEFEFFRYMPDHRPPLQEFPLLGVTLDMTRCNMEKVTLTRLNYNISGGTYRCEVSTEGPTFETNFMESYMRITALPLEDPMIDGVLSSYSIGDQVRINCTSAKSIPASELTWFINGVKAERWFLDQIPVPDDLYSPGNKELIRIQWPPDLTPATEEADEQGLRTRTLGLLFTAESRFFTGPEREMQLRCSATVGDRRWTRVVSPSLTTLTNQKLAQERLANNGSGMRRVCHHAVCVLLCLLCSLLTS